MIENKLPQISIIVPIYNVEAYLDNCITSIINQTFTDLEIILVNDGSTDNSGKICDYYANKDSRIMVIHQTNRGLSEARNIGIRIAKGTYISFIDGDDYIHPQMLEIQHYFLSQSHDSSFSIIREIITYNKVQQIFNEFNVNTASTYILTKDELMKCLYGNSPNIYTGFLANVVHCKLYKSSIIKETFFQNFKISEDTEYNSRLYLKCTNAIFIDLPMYYYIQRETSLSYQPLSSINHINRINMYYKCLCNTPSNQIAYRALVLERTYKFMLNIRYHNRHNPHILKDIALIISPILKKTISELLHNSHISLSKKIGLPIFIKAPFLYTSFIWLSEQISKIKKHVQ